MVVHVIDFSQASSNKLNPLGGTLRHHIWAELQRAQADPQVTSVVLTGGSAKNFSAGADLTEFADALSILSTSSSGGGVTILGWCPRV